MKRSDVIISGGGMVGSLAAAAAIDAGFTVTLIEAGHEPVLSKKRDLRVSAISSDNMKVLEKFNIASFLQKKRLHYFSHMRVWDAREPDQSNLTFDANFSQQQALGCMMENKNLVSAAWKKLRQSSNCQILENVKINGVENDGRQVRVSLDNDQQLKGRLLIGAEGRASFVRESIGITTTQKSYDQHGLVCYIQLSGAPQSTAFQAFNQGGPIGILPFGDDVFSIVWSLPNDAYQQWLDCDEPVFIVGLKKNIGLDFGKISLLSQRAAFPLSRLDAQRYYSGRVVLCGDSAHGIHPLAGQGVNLGIGDVTELFNSLDANVLKDDELLNLHLRRYQRRRLSQVRETSTMMSFLHHLFVDDQHIKKPLRTLGMSVLNKLPIKNWLIKQAGG